MKKERPPRFIKKLYNLYTIDVVGLYLSIPHEKGLTFLRNVLQTQSKKDNSVDTIIELEVPQKNYLH